MREDKFGVRTTIVLVVFFILIILLGSFVGRELVKVVKASINPIEESAIVLPEEKETSLQIVTGPGEQEIVERVYLDETTLKEEALISEEIEQDVMMNQVKGGVTPTNTPPPTHTNTPPPTHTNTPPPTSTPTDSPTPTTTVTETSFLTQTPTKTPPPTKLPTVGPGGSPERAKGVGLIFALLGSVALCAFFAGLASSKLRS